MLSSHAKDACLLKKWFKRFTLTRNKHVMSQSRAEELVVAIYRKLLLGDPDPDGFSHFSKALRTGAMTIEKVIDVTLVSAIARYASPIRFEAP